MKFEISFYLCANLWRDSKKGEKMEDKRMANGKIVDMRNANKIRWSNSVKWFVKTAVRNLEKVGGKNIRVSRRVCICCRRGLHSKARPTNCSWNWLVVVVAAMVVVVTVVVAAVLENGILYSVAPNIASDESVFRYYWSFSRFWSYTILSPNGFFQQCKRAIAAERAYPFLALSLSPFIDISASRFSLSSSRHRYVVTSPCFPKSTQNLVTYICKNKDRLFASSFFLGIFCHYLKVHKRQR